MPAIPDANALSEIPLFHHLTQEELARLSQLLHCGSFPARTILSTVEQPGELAYIIVQGTLKIHVARADGSEVILAIRGPGEIVGEMSLVDGLGRSATIVTKEKSTLLWIDRTSFSECLQRMPTMTHNLVRILSQRLRLASAQIQSLATQDIHGRLACQILAFAQEYGVPGADGAILIPLRLTQDELAGLIGASRVRVNQALAFFKRHGYISVDARLRIAVHDPAALALRCR